MSNNLDDLLSSPLNFLKKYASTTRVEGAMNYLEEFENWWREEGEAMSSTVDKNGTPWLQMYDKSGKRIDKIGYPSDYWRMLAKGYDTGIIWRAFEENSVYPYFLIGYVSSFFDVGLVCPYTVSMSTAVPVHKYASPELKRRFLDKMLQKKGAWQGATWFTEVRGGSDLGNNTDTIARKVGDKWLLNGEKYFCSNIGAEVAVITARVEGSDYGYEGLKMFLMPRLREDGSLNYLVKRIKDKIGTRSVPTGELELKDAEAYEFDTDMPGIYLVMEVLNVSRIANAVGSVALAQRALAEAYNFAKQRVAFGKPILEQPMLKQEIEDKALLLEEAMALAMKGLDLLDKVWLEKAPYTEDYYYFRLIAHLAKLHTAELSVQMSKWCMEVHGGIGILQEFGVERLLREAMILPIWEGTPHRQMLDGWKVITSKKMHLRFFDEIEGFVDIEEREALKNAIEDLLKEPQDEQERRLGPLFKQMAVMASKAFAVMAKEKSIRTIA